MSHDNLPEPVRKQLENAERLQTALKNGEPLTPSTEEEEARIAAEAEAEAARLAAEEEQRKADEEKAKAAKEGAGQDGANTDDGLYTPPAAQADDLQKKLEQAEARYNALRGKYDSEVPNLRAQLETLSRQQEQLLKLLEDSPKGGVEVSDEQSKADREQFGEDLVAMVDRQAMALLKRLGLSPEALKKLEDQLSEVRTVTSSVVAEVEKSSEQKMLETLHRNLPEYAQIDNDPRFGEWLQQADPISGIKRAVLYQKAGMEDFDAARVERIMRQFVAELGLKLRSDVDKGVAAPAAAVDPRAAQAAPPRGVSAPAAPAAAQKKVWTKAEVADFYNKSMRGKYSPEEAKRIEAEIFEAQREGRIR